MPRQSAYAERPPRRRGSRRRCGSSPRHTFADGEHVDHHEAREDARFQKTHHARPPAGRTRRPSSSTSPTPHASACASSAWAGTAQAANRPGAARAAAPGRAARCPSRLRPAASAGVWTSLVARPRTRARASGTGSRRCRAGRPRRRRARRSRCHTPGRSAVGLRGQAGRVQRGRRPPRRRGRSAACSAASPRGGSRASRARPASASSPIAPPIVSSASRTAPRSKPSSGTAKRAPSSGSPPVSLRDVHARPGSRLLPEHRRELRWVARSRRRVPSPSSVVPSSIVAMNSVTAGDARRPSPRGCSRDGDVELLEQRPEPVVGSPACAERLRTPGSQALGLALALLAEQGHEAASRRGSRPR